MHETAEDVLAAGDVLFLSLNVWLPSSSSPIPFRNCLRCAAKVGENYFETNHFALGVLEGGILERGCCDKNPLISHSILFLGVYNHLSFL